MPGDFDAGLTFYEVSPEHRGPLADQLVEIQGRCLTSPTGHDRATRRLWPALALPGTFWLIALFLVPFYAVMAVAFSGHINIFGEPIPAWNPLDWEFATFQHGRHRVDLRRLPGGVDPDRGLLVLGAGDLRRRSGIRWRTTPPGWPGSGAA